MWFLSDNLENKNQFVPRQWSHSLSSAVTTTATTKFTFISIYSVYSAASATAADLVLFGIFSTYKMEEKQMSPIIYELNNQLGDKSIEITKNDGFDDSKHTKTYTLDEAIEETSTYTTITQNICAVVDG